MQFTLYDMLFKTGFNMLPYLILVAIWLYSFLSEFTTHPLIKTNKAYHLVFPVGFTVLTSIKGITPIYDLAVYFTDNAEIDRAYFIERCTLLSKSALLVVYTGVASFFTTLLVIIKSKIDSRARESV